MEFNPLELPYEVKPEYDEELYRNFQRGDSMPPVEDQKLEVRENDVDQQDDWVDRGIMDVKIDDINVSDTYVHAEDDFAKVSHDEMVRGFDALEREVRPAVENGAGSDYFWELDQQRGLEYEDGSQKIYDAFYGDSAILLTKLGDRYEVTNGYHRLYVAKEIGLSEVPARVIERVGY